MFDEDVAFTDDDLDHDTETPARDYGYSRIDMTLYLAGCSYLDKGGDRLDEIVERLKSEYGIKTNPRFDGGEATKEVPNKGQERVASPSSPVEGGEARMFLPDKGLREGASSPSSVQPKPAPKQNPPRGFDAMASAEVTIKKTLMWTLKVHDGRVWARVKWCEFGSIKADSRIVEEIERRVNPPMNHFAELHEAMTDAQFEEAYDAARKLAA